jgi:hypothetical protein
MTNQPERAEQLDDVTYYIYAQDTSNGRLAVVVGWPTADDPEDNPTARDLILERMHKAALVQWPVVVPPNWFDVRKATPEEYTVWTGHRHD